MKPRRSERERIFLTEEDFNAIRKVLEGRMRCSAVSFLEEELARAHVVHEEEIDGKIVTLHSKAIVRDVASGAEKELTLVLPDHVHFAVGFESVVSPVGAAVVGLREGRSIEWRCTSSGERREFQVKKVLFQPEYENRICVAS